MYLLPGYENLLFLFYLCWLVASYVGKKFRIHSYQTYWAGIVTIVRSGLYLAYCIAFVVVILGLTKKTCQSVVSMNRLKLRI